MPIFEAEALVYNLNLVVLQLLDKNQVQDVKKTAQDDTIVVAMDGGGFDDKR